MRHAFGHGRVIQDFCEELAGVVQATLEAEGLRFEAADLRVAGDYLKQPFAGVVRNLSSIARIAGHVTCCTGGRLRIVLAQYPMI